MLGIGKRGQIASLITADLQRKDATKRRGQDIDVLRERMGISGRQTAVETQEKGAMSREELAQKSATHRTRIADAGDMARQKLIAQSSYKQATDVAGIRGEYGLKQQGLANKGAVATVGERGTQDRRSAKEEATRYESLLATIPAMSDEAFNYNPSGVDLNAPVRTLAEPTDKIDLSEEEKRRKKGNSLFTEYLTLP